MDDYSGLLVALEGIDGSGKTTQVKLVCQLLEQQGYSSFATHEPTRTKVGQILRQYLADPSSIPSVDALIFAADRIEHYHTEIKPSIEHGEIVVTDRYKYSSIVYQGFAGVPQSWIKEINKMVPDPDITIFLDISVTTAIERLNQAGRDHLEKFETQQKLEKIRSMYLELDMKNRIIIDAELEEEKIAENIINEIIKVVKVR